MAGNLDQEAHIADPESEEDFEDDEEEEEAEDWDDWSAEDGEESSSGLLCLFCDANFSSCSPLFDHCASLHRFDFHRVKEALALDFYGAFKLINYVRSQVAENRCWSCGLVFPSKHDLQDHLHETIDFEKVKPLSFDDRYLKPFLQEDSLLYSFDEDGEGEDDCPVVVDKEELAMELKNLGELSIDGDNLLEKAESSSGSIDGNVLKGAADVSSSDLNTAGDVRRVNESYFGAYSSFGIHREMLSDKVRMDAYSQAILGNQSLFNGAVVMDVGCGTGILSLFAAQAGASEVIAVEASEKMAAVATQIAKDNHFWHSPNGSINNKGGVVKVVNGMVEELDKCIQLQPHSVDVLLSEWMGYCLLYETMLSSVLSARDRWLKPGGAILPDTATIFAAGFGRGATSLPFWERVYGFDMSTIGKEIVEDAARNPIVDVMSESDLVTNPVIVQTFDLVTMKPDEVDFTASIELETSSSPTENQATTMCYGVVLWFETGFTSRFCREQPAVLSTSPHTLKTHWAQTILTFREPIAMLPRKADDTDKRSQGAGIEGSPAEKIHLRVSIVRAPEHRSIDISLEAAAICSDGRKVTYPVQIFNLS
ncbi:hypothetical protein CRG98_010772 [Punica granatum]|uniref:C2H2-type domain-containing protein n=1 Tax=Punica granatum TaxID=22663 RepID=A0A2I0KJM4_PUNGR|nr:hypothetical protein CRG98_010772 [Punica granatum]